jgi:integration host factor subunit alpha
MGGGQNVSKSTMTKADIVEKVYQKIGFSKKEASELVELVFTSLKEQLYAGQKVKISGFGNFIVKNKNERLGRNPRTTEQMIIAARRVVTFRASQVLKALLKGEDITGLTDDKDDDDHDEDYGDDDE